MNGLTASHSPHSAANDFGVLENKTLALTSRSGNLWPKGHPTSPPPSLVHRVYDVLECACTVRMTVPSPNPSLFAIWRRDRSAATCSRSKPRWRPCSRPGDEVVPGAEASELGVRSCNRMPGFQV